PDGTTICGPGFPNDLTCSADDGGTYTVIVRDSSGTFTGNYTMAFRKLNSSAGCTALSFGAAPLAGTITVAGQMDCYKVSGLNAGDQLRVRVVETSGSLVALQEVIRPNGTSVCTPTGAVDVTCPIDTTGTHTILVEDNNGTFTGKSVFAVQKRIDSTRVPFLSSGGAPITGSISTAGEMDCYTFSGSAGDRIRLRMVNTTGGSFFPTAELIRPNGTTVCGPSFPNDITCTVNKTGTYTVIVRDSTGTFSG